jgi:predicted O-methyltransferase YrrM
LNKYSRFTYSMRFLKFLKNSRTRYSIHSPFLYDLIMACLYRKHRLPDFSDVEMLRGRLRKDYRVISKTDFGTGEGQYEVKISEIAKNSLSSRSKLAKITLLARFLKVRKIIEIGTSLGISTAYLARSGPDVEMLSLEGCPETAKSAKANLASLNINNAGIIEGEFQTTLPEALEKLRKIDMVFIDGNHRKDPVMEYFSRCLEYAGNDSVFIIDDIHWSEEMEEAWHEIKSNAKVRLSLDLFHMGWVFFRKESSPQEFILRYL